jgi:hypothetical protein
MNITNYIILAGLVILLYGGFFVFVYYRIIKPSWNLYDLCTELENEIRNTDDFENQIQCLYELKNKSWHRTTGARIRELALMMEIKYKVEILKR